MITKAQAEQLNKLLSELVRLGGADVHVIRNARRAIAQATEGQYLPQQLEFARQREQLPRCSHDRPLMDWSGEQLVPPCGCRLVEPTKKETTR